MQTAKISFYRDIWHPESSQTIELDRFLMDVQSGRWQDEVLRIRNIKDKFQRQEAKKSLPNVTISGIFSQKRQASNIGRHSGFIGIDLDGLNEDCEKIKKLLSRDPHVYACFVSVSGSGLCVIYCIDGQRHKDAYDAIASYLVNEYQVIPDTSGKDCSRTRFVSYDPFIYINSEAIQWRQYLPKEKETKESNQLFVPAEFDGMIKAMVEKKVNCCDDYRDWIAVCYGLIHQFGKDGRKYFHILSKISDKYDKEICDKQFDVCLKNQEEKKKYKTIERPVTIGTIYYHAKKAGIEIYSEQTKKITKGAHTLKKSGQTPEQIAESLKQHEGIDVSIETIKDALKADAPKGENIVDDLKLFVKANYKIVRNLITRKLENNGVIVDDIELNTIYLEALKVFPKLSFDLFCKVLFSNHTPTYNPILDFFANHVFDYEDGTIDLFFDCIKVKSGDLSHYGKKWLVSIISAAHGRHSPLMLILAGERQGTGKTEAFRRLLPNELQPYYAESKLDAGKDDEILMTQKLIIMDDEMGGKSKAESKRLKELTSKQTFTLREPYGRNNVDLSRLAVLCGTTNDLGILNDPTGNRRMLPFEVTEIDYETMNGINRVHLIMEAYHLYHNGYNWQLNKDDIEKLANETDQFQEINPEREMLIKFFEPCTYTFKTATEVKNILEIHTVQRFSLKRIGQELSRLKFQRVKQNGVYGYMIRTIDG